ncbi:hypothetical protein IE81DRAFT_333594 [Ceraceosorus guamensis]|uniref:Kinetochore protein NDC80 n=1 Tax=Ceraceosorus guamensis TaxID=1522189 RepID=A0A316W478_9BASI|nr:hypothetical protein IE81DRAFT_333594 [Ceraceosorus guamensis]PWN44650.1 hypothetical protein IE81DRAFT_333594 [Ceraceosorus guamensis]
MAPGMGPGIHSVRALTEPRPLRSRPFMEEVKERVFDFLQRTGFSAPGFSHKSMNDPTQTHFLSMFRHIYNKSIDNTYTFTKDNKREADEIISLLNDIKYPLIGDLSKMKLGAAGSAQNWPSIVAMLDWIVCMNSTFANDTKYGGAGPLERELEDEQDDQQLFYKFLWECYDKFWQNQDTFPDEVAALDQIFAERNAGVTKQVEELESEELKLDQQLREYTDHDSPLTKQTREKELLEGDITKFIKYRDDILLPKLAKSKGTLKALNEQIEQKLTELKRAEQEAVTLKKQVDSQGISESDFDAMTKEKENLLKQSHDIAEENNEAAKRSWNLELEVSKLQSRVEELFKTFNSLARKVGLFPLDLKDGSGSQLQELEIVPRNPSSMLPPGVDIKSLIKPAIERLRSREVEKFKKICEECLVAQDNVDRISEELTAVRETHIALQGRLDRQQEIFEETLAVNGSEHQAIESKKADDEAKLLQMQQAGHLAMQHAEARLSSLKRQLQTAKQNDEQHRLALHRELESAALDVANLKMKVAAAIEKLGQDAQRL